MKFEIEEYHRNIPDEEIIADIKRVATKLKQDSLLTKEYIKFGKFSLSLPCRRFGWLKALEQAGLRKLKIQHKTWVSDEEVIADIKQVATELRQDFLLRNQYDKFGKFSSSGTVAKFTSWSKAIERAGLRKTRDQNGKVSEEELFRNLEEVWVKLGRQPRQEEMFLPNSKYSKVPYKNHFGSWTKALYAFVEYINKENNFSTEEAIKDLQIEPITRHKTNRNINYRLRFIVMQRDNFKCRRCGRSPATDPTIILHVDHKKAWANGGETVMENLQVLCSKCNIGKSDL